MSETDCAAGQVCGSDRFCASPELAGRCAAMPTGDAGVSVRDAAVHPVDATTITADAKPDGPPPPPTTTLELHVEGQGRISVPGVGICDSAQPDNGDCSFVVLKNVQLQAQAIPHNDWRFDKWTTSPCNIEDSAQCGFTPIAPVNVTAKFRKDD
ncbi:MAG TPA: hypothetical protein VMZ53_17095 [Kofleriaceae bacterium]|nr:hypothetical protein [Kofleriaceae bacterium]